MKNRSIKSKIATAPGPTSREEANDLEATLAGDGSPSAYDMLRANLDTAAAILLELQLMNFLLSQLLIPQSVDLEELRSHFN